MHPQHKYYHGSRIEALNNSRIHIWMKTEGAVKFVKIRKIFSSNQEKFNLI
jgi:hypothetical protein